jgi:hypothetical protein
MDTRFTEHTMEATESIPDDALMSAFETNAIAHADWTHRAHVRIAYLLLTRNDLLAAITAMRNGLKSLNIQHGSPTNMLRRGYHETITVVFMQLIHSLLARYGPFSTSIAFCDTFPAVNDKRLLQRFYSEDRLWSWHAKQAFVEPDLRPLDWTDLSPSS